MASFGGSAICPRCTKTVYAAEQVLGPGRKFYHKPCLACMTCKKRLDSFTLLEHDQEPYCKSCHAKNFGTHNISNRPDPLLTPPRKRPTADTPEESPSPLAGKASNTGRFGTEALPRTVQLSPTRTPDSPDGAADADQLVLSPEDEGEPDLNTSGYSSRAMAPIAERYASAAMVQRRHMTGDGESPPRQVARTLTGGQPVSAAVRRRQPEVRALREERVFCGAGQGSRQDLSQGMPALH
ncbi:Cysteine and glycine-rich protein 3 [Mycena venus]|uniref:Cysteine and glycine-rich protein 3 n=1 Tax=Mycena venus TaxID=2733690 RepID=A0A8H6U1Z3_9AGAR|nr:Cysteine and glycine-rich protein 3 [Mycena venus]